jgi:DNA-binding response OmpR family regulator
MDPPPTRPMRILVVARPALGRRIELVLRTDGHEVHRTPDPSATEQLAARLHPQAVVVALDLPWGDALAAAERLRDGDRPVPVLLVGNEGLDPLRNEFPRLPLGADAADLRAAVNDLFASPARPN